MSLQDRLTVDAFNRRLAVMIMARECRRLLAILVAEAERELSHEWK